eukprot:gene21173-27431_t
MSQVDNHLKTGGEILEYKNKPSGNLTVSSKCGDIFQELKLRRKHRYIIFKIGEQEVEVETVGKRNETLDNLKKALPYTDCRYVIYDQEYKTADGRLVSKLWFISWLPNNSTPYGKMAYTSTKGKLRDTLPGVFDIQAANPDELDAALGLSVEEEEEEDFDF